MTLLVKLGLGVLGLGTTGAAGYGVYELIRPRTIADQLKWEGLDLADVVGNADDKEEGGWWKKLFDKYKEGNNQDKFKEGEKTDVTIGDKDKLKKHCGDVFKMDKSDEENLEQARNWCVRNSKKLAV